VTAIAEQAERLVAWFLRVRRDLPWRTGDVDGFRDPYRVWISEIMLQQTQVEAVKAHYRAWMERFPNVAALAQAEEAEVLRHWQGLGYYSRARNILRTARMVVHTYNGTLPLVRAELEALPGIGAYTAGAILSLAWHKTEPLLDGNLVRVFSRLQGWDFLPDAVAHKKAYWDEARKWCEAGPAHLVNEALMELGALVCTPKNPRCAECPLQPGCYAAARDWRAFPPRKTLAFMAWKGFAVLCENAQGQLLCVRAASAPFLQGQSNFPYAAAEQITGNHEDALAVAVQVLGWPRARLRGAEATFLQHPVRHAIMRYRIELRVVHVRLCKMLDVEGEWLEPAAVGEHIVNSMGLKVWKMLLRGERNTRPV
jgi:A/G-specific adenine glycosylase